MSKTEAASQIDATVREWAGKEWSPRPLRHASWRGAIEIPHYPRANIIMVTGDDSLTAARECFSDWVSKIDATDATTGGLVVPILSGGLFGPDHVHPVLSIFSTLERVFASQKGDSGTEARSAWLQFVGSMSQYGDRTQPTVGTGPLDTMLRDVAHNSDLLQARDLVRNFERMVDHAVAVVAEQERGSRQATAPQSQPMFAVLVEDAANNTDRFQQCARHLMRLNHPRICLIVPCDGTRESTITIANRLPGAVRIAC